MGTCAGATFEAAQTTHAPTLCMSTIPLAQLNPIAMTFPLVIPVLPPGTAFGAQVTAPAWRSPRPFQQTAAAAYSSLHAQHLSHLSVWWWGIWLWSRMKRLVGARCLSLAPITRFPWTLARLAFRPQRPLSHCVLQTVAQLLRRGVELPFKQGTGLPKTAAQAGLSPSWLAIPSARWLPKLASTAAA